MKTFIIVALALASFSLKAESYLPWKDIEVRFANAGGSPYALKHVKCFYESKAELENAPHIPTDINFNRRCLDQGNIKLGNKRHFVVIDYTKSSEYQRLFIVDRVSGSIFKTSVAHGRYKASYINIFKGHLKNTIKNATYFSNEINSNAPASGFYIAGQDYKGNFGRSVVLHGLEIGVNHNSCERAIVIHPHRMVSPDNVSIMSSGCPMVSHKVIDRLIDTIGGKMLSEDDILMTEAGGLVFIYSDREKSLKVPCL